ncbi:MAG TPA: hypothetical protein QGF58_07565 [Myxococcota bacterium]|nr:hypothetical protein [Myxococcota bacterium]
MSFFIAAVAAQAAPPQVVQVHTNTSDIRELLWDGQVLWAATGGGLEAWSEDGRLLAHATIELPTTDLVDVAYTDTLVVTTGELGSARWDEQTGAFVPAVAPAMSWRTMAVEVRSEGLVIGEDTLALGCPVLDVAVAEDIRIACLFTSFVYDGEELVEVGIPATAAHPEGWGLRGGGVITDDAGRIGAVPGAVTSLEKVGDAWFIGTEDGLYLLENSLERLTPDGQICGNFITGADRFRGELVVTTFQDGACRFDGESWHPIEGLPGRLVNDVVVHGESAWMATSHGLARWDGDSVEVITEGASGRGRPGLQHDVVTALASGERLWMSDLLGPVSVDEGYWRRHRFSVFGTSYQAVAACGPEAWVASEDAGVSHWSGRRWSHHDGSTGLPDDWVMAVACTEGEAWAGTYRDGVWRWDGRSWTAVETPDDWILSLAIAEEGLYVGTLGGLFLVGDETVTIEVLDPRVHQLSVTEEELFVGTEGGLTTYMR